MPKENNVNIKIELCKDKSTNSLALMLHFFEKSPNIVIENSKYFWYPTEEEKNLINDSFAFIPGNSIKYTTPKPTSSETVVNEEPKEEPIQELEIPTSKPEPEITPSMNDIDTQPSQPDTPEPSFKEEEDITPKVQINPPVPPMEEPEIKEEKKKIFQLNKKEPEISLPIEPTSPPMGEPEPAPDAYPPGPDETIKDNTAKDENSDKKQDGTEEDKEEDEHIIVAADDAAIERALKKRNDKDENDSLVQADERLIIEKVLNQKKKGKWSKK